MRRTPVLQALILADHIYSDSPSGKKVIAGTFNTLWANRFPTEFVRETYAYICLTELRGEADLSLKYVQLASNQVLMETTPVPIRSDDPLKTTEICVRVPPFPMPTPGTYAFEVHVGGEMLGSLRILVRQIEEAKS